ncbi:MAG: hypothetical protein CMB77_04380 [Euryarchaeota archaeon]|nr:hypothetical protein [Euryarchaeota archaeon]|tara:strand:- start:34490 stop:36415 length:1926 start_codon:yes stop_codon:yes gene_type:complete
MEKDIRNKQKKIVKRSYLARDFDGFKNNLVQHARTFFPDNLEDFTETGLGGMFVDMISYIGDSMSFYLDHQFNELRWQDAVEIENLKKHIRLAGVETHGASPATTYVSFYIEVPLDGDGKVIEECLPTIKKGTRLISGNGITFNLMEDVDFTLRRKNDDRDFVWKFSTPQPPRDGIEANGKSRKIINLKGLCVSGEIRDESFSIPDSFIPFREISLSEQNISLIESVTDSDGNVYYEVDNLSQDNVFSVMDNKNISQKTVEQTLVVTPAPYRYTRYFDPQLLSTTLTFGGGDATADDNDILPDPGDLSMPLYGKRVFSRFALDPNSLLRTNTLGVAPRQTTITINYRHGGGLIHNVSAESIRTIDFLDMTFPTGVDHEDARLTRASLAVRNHQKASGGAPAPSINELRDQIPVARNSQSRIVTKEDLVARIYALPSALGRVFRAAVSETPDANGQIEIALISRGSSGRLVKFGSMDTSSSPLEVSGDNLKLNLKTYLESFRLINDSYIIMDAAVHNFGLNINVIAVPGAQKANVVQSIITNLKKLLSIKNFHINQPLSLGDISYAVMSSDGVASIHDSDGLKGITVVSKTGVVLEGDGVNTYDYGGSEPFEPLLEKGYIFPKKNGIFELRYPDFDIRVSVR